MTFACSSNTFDSKKKKKKWKKKKKGERGIELANYDANYNVVNYNVSTPWIFYSFMIKVL